MAFSYGNIFQRKEAQRVWFGGRGMINFEEELKNYQPSIEVEEAESAIYNHDLTDVTDIIAEMMRDMKQNNGR